MTYRSRLLAGLVAAAIVISGAGAGAQETPTTQRTPGQQARRAAVMDEVKSRCLRQIELRHTAMARVKQRISSSRFLSDDHEAALAQDLDATASSLSRLADAIQAEDDFDELRAECRSIVLDHRVFVLVMPHARLVTAADAALAAAARLTAVADRLQTRIDEAKGQGKDTAEAQSDLAQMRGHIAVAIDQADGVYDGVIGITPAEYNTNHQILDDPRRAVRACKDELRAAVVVGRKLRNDLDRSSGKTA